MDNILLLIVCLTVGMLLRRYRKVPENAHQTINAFIINIALPATILTYIHNVRFEPRLMYIIAMPWLLFMIGACFFWIVGRTLRLPAPIVGALMLLGGLGNTSFLGLPMIEAFYGRPGMATGILIDQLGTYAILSTVGVAIASMYAETEGSLSWRTIAYRVVIFPPFICLLIAFALMYVPYPSWLNYTLVRLSSTLAPLALVSVGLQLRFAWTRDKRTPVALGLFYKMLMGPAILTVLFSWLAVRGQDVDVGLFETAMSPQIGAAIVASQYNLDTDVIVLMVGLGTLLAFFSLPVWASVLV